MTCKQCGTDEDRTDGFCSIECRRYCGYEKEISELKAEVERLQQGINDLRCYNGDSEEMSNIFARLKRYT